jgi:glycosyltransferase involved in cell wall biosynthesis
MSDSLTIWLLQTGEPLHIDEGNPRPMRAMNLANALVESGHKVVLWSSSFYHQEKRHRLHGRDRITVSPKLEIRLISSPGYQHNIGLGRLWDHAVLARNLAKELSKETLAPDVAFIGYPPIEAAAVMTRWLATRGIPCMLDVKDQWPNIFVDALPSPLRPFGRVVLMPYFYYARRSFRDATAVTSMAKGFLQWSAEFAGREISKLDKVVPLTTPTGQVSTAELEEAERWWDQQGVKADGTFRICFVGSHSRAFDMGPVFEAAKLASHSGQSIQFVLCGDGEESSAWQAEMKGLSNVLFPGWVDRAKVEALALRSSVTLAPYHNVENFIMNIPNKVVDSLALGLPVLSSLRGEVQRLILDFNVGLSYGPVGEKTLLSCIHELADVPALRDRLSDNARKVFIERFSFESVYGDLVSHLEMLARRRDAQRIS